jgi:catechol 2,3-dioxygenase-like lactoylglutathione lyase family enzyme
MVANTPTDERSGKAESLTVRAIDHVNLRIPLDDTNAAVRFYSDILGFNLENRDRYEAGQKSFFSIRLANESVIHFRPVEDFEPPTEHNFDHVALLIEESIESVKALLAAHDIDVEREGKPLGATGTAPAIYVRDPFGYLLEIKERGDD